MSGHKRRIFFIKRALQARLLLGYFFFVISGGVFFTILMGFLTTERMTISYSANNLEMVQTPLALLRQSIANEWPYLLLGCVIMVIAAIRVTHRVAGPLYRFEQTLDNMLTGDLGDSISLRSKDEGKELATKINSFNTELSTALNKVTGESNAIRELLLQARTKADQLPKEEGLELKSILWSIDEKNKKIAIASKHYTEKTNN